MHSTMLRLFKLRVSMSRCNNRVDMKSLRSISIISKAFQSANSLELIELEALESIDIGDDCFNGTSSFSLRGMIEWLK